MNIANILAETGVVISTIGKIENVIELDWLGKIIKSLIEGCNSIGLGIIVFTLILKLITLPLDIFSRVSTKKSSVMMEKMRPELERLQRQYANNKDLYQRKMQDLYKKNNYSPFSACLPTLINLIFFIVVIGQF
jgi:YidC/Oxa1 family membrane protein insertase